MTYSSVVSRDNIRLTFLIAGFNNLDVIALFGLRSAGVSWRADLAELLFSLGYESTKADPDIWIHPAVTEFGTKYYKMLCVYVDMNVSVSSKARDGIQQIIKVFIAKEGIVGVPQRYLGTDIEKIQAADERMVWSTSPHSYIKNAIRVVEDLFAEDGFDDCLKKKTNPRAGYLEVLCHMFEYFKSHPDMG
eukprot:11487110-Ditylum_brightwellii.AAC.1